MKKNQSLTNLTAPILSVRGEVSQLNAKKIQGFDKIKTYDEFPKKIQKLKNRSKNISLQDEYVKGLQDEIYYLETQLKLLKQKQISKQSNIDQLQTFFGDGIPINENILALKNGFNNYKSQINKKIIQKQNQKKQRQSIIQGLSSTVKDITKNIHDQEINYKKYLIQKSDVTHEKVKKEVLLKEQSKNQQEILRNIKLDNRKLAQSITQLQRAKEIKVISLLKLQNSKLTKLNKLRDSISQKQKQYDELLKNYEKLKKKQQQKNYVIIIQQDNLKLKKKIISLDKQFNSIAVKIQQKKIQLDQKLKQRHQEIVAKMDIQLRLDSLKQTIDRENSLKIQDLQKLASERVSSILQGIVAKNKKLSKYITYYSDLLIQVDDKINSSSEKKPDLKKQYHIQQNQLSNIYKDEIKQKQLSYQLSSQLSKIKSKYNYINIIVPSLIDTIKKEEQKIKLNKLQRQKLIQDIKIKQKQLQLTEILKLLSLQQIHISNSSNTSIQDRILDFMNSWENIKRN